MRFLSAGESHGKCLTTIIEGVPAGLTITSDYINHQLKRRQQGYGRGGRMKLESDRVEFLSGLRFSETLGSPLTLQINNRDAVNWKETMACEGEKPAGSGQVKYPRPGHADYAGGVKYRRNDFRDILERSSARETAVRVAAGSVARRLLEELDIFIYSHVVSIGGAKTRYLTADEKSRCTENNSRNAPGITSPPIYEKIESSPLRCACGETEKEMMKEIDGAREKGDTLGGVFEIIVTGVPPGLGSHVHWDRRLDGRLAGALMSLQGIKGVEAGMGFLAAERPGSQVHDPFSLSESGAVCRPTNRAGGLEGGISNGEPVILRAAMKPIPTLMNPLQSIDFAAGKETFASVERSDVCAVPAASVVAEAITAWEIAVSVLDRFARDTVTELKSSYSFYLEMIKPLRNLRQQ